MKQSAHAMVRKTIDIDTELSKTIQEMADKVNWSFSYMSYVLLQQATKERLRKRAKKDNTEHHPPNMG